MRVRLDDGNSDVMGDRRSAEDNRLGGVMYDRISVGDKAQGDGVEKGLGDGEDDMQPEDMNRKRVEGDEWLHTVVGDELRGVEKTRQGEIYNVAVGVVGMDEDRAEANKERREGVRERRMWETEENR